jgi:hypothetical protein
VDLDQDIVIPQRRVRHVAEAQGAVLLVSIYDESLHDNLFSSFLPTLASGWRAAIADSTCGAGRA